MGDTRVSDAPVKSWKQRVRRAVRIVLTTVAGVYVAIGLLAWVFQRRLVYFPRRVIDATPAEVGLAYEPEWFRAADGVKLFGWFVPADGARATVLICHGNAGNISHRLTTLSTLNQLGLSAFIFDYRGYGLSEASPGEEGTYRDAEGAWAWLVGRGVRPERIVILGRSLGGAIAAHLAAERTPAALIVESAFTSLPDLGSELYPILPIRLMCRFGYDTREYLKRAGCPVLVVHSRSDHLVPFHHGQALFTAAAQPKQFLPLEGGHNDGFIISGRLYKRTVSAFLDEHLDRPAASASAPATRAAP